MDKVSIIIPTYNRFKYLIYNLQFIKKQTYSNFEIIIINDGSTEKYILIKAGKVPHDRRGQDAKTWKKCMEYTNSVYVDEVLCYYDLHHGYGTNH